MSFLTIRLARTRRPTFRLHSEGLEFLLEPADPHPENKPPSRQHIQGGDLFGGHQRVALRHEANARAEPQRRGVGSGPGERQKGVE